MKEFKWRCSFWFESIQCGGWKIGKIPNIILLKNSLDQKPSPTWTMGRLIDLHGFVPAADQTCSPCRWIHLVRKPTTRRRLVLWNPSQLFRYWPKTIGGSKLPNSFPSHTSSVSFTRFAAGLPPLWRSQSKPFPPLPTSEASYEGICTMQRIQWSNSCKTKLKTLFSFRYQCLSLRFWKFLGFPEAWRLGWDSSCTSRCLGFAMLLEYIMIECQPRFNTKPLPV